MRPGTPPRPLPRSSKKPVPWCVLDATNTPAVMRCKHCRTEVPVHFPMDLGQHKSELDAFLAAHTLCGLGLRKLYAKRKLIQLRLQSPKPMVRGTWRRRREELQKVEAAIMLLRTKR